MLMVDMHAKSFSRTSTHWDGKGETILINDSGFDLGNMADLHPAFKDTGRLKDILAYWPDANARDFIGHGTHVAGSVGGVGFSDKRGESISGVATGASLLVQSVCNSDKKFKPPTDYASLLLDAYEKHNVRISSNSWGQSWKDVPKQMAYGTAVTDRTLDAFIWTHPDMIVVVSAGNAGRDRWTKAQISAAAAAKNCITVGATFSSRPCKISDFKFDPRTNTTQSADQIAAFSSRGPTSTGRIKPDIVAPGVTILSASSRDEEFIASGKAAEYGESGDELYRFSSGTSMSTPLVAGCCALIRQMLIAGGIAKPMASLVKAIIINGALADGETHTAHDAAKVSPDGAYGWGRVDLDRALFDVGKSTEQGIHQDEKGILPGEFRDIELPIQGEKQHLKATLVWTDPQGPILNNPIGLKVLNGADPENALIGTGYDATKSTPTDNVQQVIVHGITEHMRIKLRVVADWPFTDNTIAQPFAVVWSLDA